MLPFTKNAQKEGKVYHKTHTINKNRFQSQPTMFSRTKTNYSSAVLVRRRGFTHPSVVSLDQLICGEDWNLVKMECETDPQAASVWSKAVGFFDGRYESRVLPLHRACSLRPPVHVIKSLVNAYPQAVSAKETEFKRLPIHVAVQMEASADVVDFLLLVYPMGAMTKDNLGRLPLHYAMSHGASADVVKSILAAFPAAAGVEEHNGWLPIHVAMNYSISPDVLEMMLEAFPGSTLVKTKKGNTALSIAKKNGAHPDNIKILEEAKERESIMFKTDLEREKTSYSVQSTYVARGA
mmetsp:Transcript_12132/g.17689  ORF Transcript_12132/g.17689 Transcript_12132/m.17689 type:complete len:294 (+) Transcript_12132:11-892(+)